MNDNFVNIWEPFNGLQNHKANDSETKNLALVILNQPITENISSRLINLWRNSVVRICVDGGVDQLFKWQKKMLTSAKINLEESKEIQSYFPDYILGDLDSCSLERSYFYESKGSKRFQLYNQDLSDFQKTLKFLVSCIREGGIDSDLIKSNSKMKSDIQNIINVDFEQIYSVCDFGGRVDHCIANMHSLYIENVQRFQTYILSDESLTFLLKKGVNLIYIDNDLYCGTYCGFFPLGNEAIMNTFGLKWNIYNRNVKFGSFVSSSNEMIGVVTDEEKKFIDNENIQVDIERRHILIKTDQPIIWTMSIK